jgi:golgin subfamily B member 1
MTSYVYEVCLRGSREEGINFKGCHVIMATVVNGKDYLGDPVPVSVENLAGLLPEWFGQMAAQVGAAEADRDAKVAAAHDERDAAIEAARSERDEAIAVARAAAETAKAAAETDRDEKVAAAVAAKDQLVAEAAAGRAGAEALVAERDGTIAGLNAQVEALTARIAELEAAPKPPSDRTIHKAWLRAALASIERLAEVDAAVQSAGPVHWELWANATTISRDDADVVAIAEALKVDLDAVFAAARAIQVARGGT